VRVDGANANFAVGERGRKKIELSCKARGKRRSKAFRSRNSVAKMKGGRKGGKLQGSEKGAIDREEKGKERKGGNRIYVVGRRKQNRRA